MGKSQEKAEKQQAKGVLVDTTQIPDNNPLNNLLRKSKKNKEKS